MNGARRLKKSEQLSPEARYELLLRLASGGMGAVFVGVARGAAGTDVPLYAIKRAHAHLIEQAEFRKMFVAEASLARRIHHPNAVGVIDVDESDGELMMIMRYVEGGSFSDMLVASHERGRRISPPVTLRIIADAARGLEAAHALRDERGQPLGIVHRDVSPHNILVGLDGISSIVDFGVAKAASTEMTRTATDIMKGKTAYMAPEYVKSRVANAQTDVFALGIVAWEALANRRLFKGEDEMDTIKRLLDPSPAPLLHQIVDLDPTVAAVVARSVAKDPEKRFLTASAFGEALENAARTADLLASPAEVASTAKTLLAAQLTERRQLLAEALEERARLAPSRQVTMTVAALTQVAPRPPSSPPAHVPSSAPPAAPPTPLAARPTMSMGGMRLEASTIEAPPSQHTAWMPTSPRGMDPSSSVSGSVPSPVNGPMSGPISGRSVGIPTAVMSHGYPPPGAPLRSTAPSIPHLDSFHEAAPTQAMDPSLTFDAATAARRQRVPRAGAGRAIGIAAGLVVVVLAVLGVVLLGPSGADPEGAPPEESAVAPAAPSPPATAADLVPVDEPAVSAAPTASAAPSTAPSAAPDEAPASSSSPAASASPATSGPAPAAATGAPGAPRPGPGGGSWRPKANPY